MICKVFFIYLSDIFETKENLEVTQNVVLSRNVLKTRGLHFKHIEIKKSLFLVVKVKGHIFQDNLLKV